MKVSLPVLDSPAECNTKAFCLLRTGRNATITGSEKPSNVKNLKMLQSGSASGNALSPDDSSVFVSGTMKSDKAPP